MAELNWPELVLMPVNLWSLSAQLPVSKEPEFNDADEALKPNGDDDEKLF